MATKPRVRCRPACCRRPVRDASKVRGIKALAEAAVVTAQAQQAL